MLKVIEGTLTAEKRLVLKDINSVSSGENLTTALKISLPAEVLGYRYYLEFDCGGKSYISEWIEPDAENKLNYTLPAAVISRTGEVKVQLVAAGQGDNIIIFKSLIGDESGFYVFSSINADEVAIRFVPNAVTRAETAANNCFEAAEGAAAAAAYAVSKGNEAAAVAAQALEDKQNGLFKGEKGDKGDNGVKGDPSNIDKNSTPSSSLNLSDNYASAFGSIPSPLIISQNTSMSFTGFTSVSGYQKAFLLYVKRSADVTVTWPASVVWANNAPPLLPVGKVQKIFFETVNGAAYFGTAGDYFDV